ncbi:uncharacterized protein LOC143773344 [Ranitomeya variabilis]|uniref:uncharacterized protein LOC143773344 n=1 Tax=Ranitomeya variabilis TaxID=490064 RepID=UPI0040571F15
MRNNYCFPHRFSVQPITYPTPPYMSIRREGIEMFQLPVTQRKLMDMIKKFDPNDISYIDDQEFITMQKTDITSIRDPLSKYFVIKGDTVWARSLQGANEQAKFKVSLYINLNKTKPPITLQVQNQDLFLSYQPNEQRQLKVLPLGQRNLDITNPDTRHFFFNIIEVANKKFSLEPVTEPDWFISTAPDNGPVTVEPSSDQTHYMAFSFDINFNIGYISGSRVRLDTEDTSKYDASFYSYNNRTVRDRYRSFLARDGYRMDVCSLGLDDPYRRRRQDNHRQSYYLGWH